MSSRTALEVFVVPVKMSSGGRCSEALHLRVNLGDGGDIGPHFPPFPLCGAFLCFLTDSVCCEGGRVFLRPTHRCLPLFHSEKKTTENCFQFRPSPAGGTRSRDPSGASVGSIECD